MEPFWSYQELTRELYFHYILQNLKESLTTCQKLQYRNTAWALPQNWSKTSGSAFLEDRHQYLSGSARLMWEMRAVPTWQDKVHDRDRVEQCIYDLCFRHGRLRDYPDVYSKIKFNALRILANQRGWVNHKDQINACCCTKDSLLCR